MTKEQNEMMDNAPERNAEKKTLITKKRAMIAAGVVAVGVGAYFIGPKVVNKVQAYRAVKAAASVI